jgi:hypothetical protein
MNGRVSDVISLPNPRYFEKLGLQSRKVGGAVAGISMGRTSWHVVTLDPDRLLPSMLILSRDPDSSIPEIDKKNTILAKKIVFKELAFKVRWEVKLVVDVESECYSFGWKI